MHQAHVLTKVVFSEKGSLFRTLLLAGSPVVVLQMFLGWVELFAKDALALTRLGTDDRPQRCAYPFFQAKMETELVSFPVVLGTKRVRAKCAFYVNQLQLLFNGLRDLRNILRPSSATGLGLTS